MTPSKCITNDNLKKDPFYSKVNIDELVMRISNLEEGKTTLKEHELIENAQ